MLTILTVCAVVGATCMVVCAGALLWMGVAVNGACRVVKRSASRISGAVAAARELASRVDGSPKVRPVAGSTVSHGSAAWGDLLGDHPRR